MKETALLYDVAKDGHVEKGEKILLQGADHPVIAGLSPLPHRQGGVEKSKQVSTITKRILCPKKRGNKTKRGIMKHHRPGIPQQRRLF